MTSICSFTTFGGALPAALAAERMSFSRVPKSERAAIAIPAPPAFANERAVARPTPLEAPVMRT
jgi:hypothetical protein